MAELVEQVVPSRVISRSSRFRRRLWQSPLTIVGAVGAVGVVASAIFAGILAPHDYAALDLAHRTQPPSGEFLLGTDQFGRDLLSRILYGGQISLLVGLLSTLVGSVLGVMLGAIAGFWGSWIDELIMRVMDVLLAFPQIVLAIAFAAVLGPNVANVIVIIGILQVPQFARLVRSSVLVTKEEDFIVAARTIGLRESAILMQHVLPNVLGPLIVLASLTVPSAIITEAALSFLGLGVQPPTPSWGNILADGRQFVLTAPWIATFAGLAITVTVLSLNFFGDGLRDALDPRTAD